MPHLSWKLYDIGRFDDYASAWDRINANTRCVPILNSSFIRNALEVFGTGTERLGVLGPAGSEQALCIVSKVRNGVWQTWQPSQLPLGAWVMERTQQYEDLLAGLLRTLPGFPLLVAVTQQDPSIHERPAVSSRLRSVDYIRTAWIDVEGSFDSYWNARGKNLRKNMRTQRSRLAKQQTRASLEVVETPDLVAEAIADYGRLESAGWKGAEGSAVHADNEQGRFYRAVFEDFCRRGAGRIYRYRFDGRVVAVDLCLESGGTQVVVKTTYDESIRGGLSPSSLLREEAFRKIFDEGRLRKIEFYGRVMEWTTRWTDRIRTLYHVNLYRSRSAAAVALQLSRLRSRRAVQGASY